MLSPLHQPEKGVTKSASQNAAALIEMTAEQAVAQGILFAGNPETVYRQIMEFQRKAGAFGHLNIIGRSGFLTHQEAVKGIKMFAREVLPRLEERPVGNHDVAELATRQKCLLLCGTRLPLDQAICQQSSPPMLEALGPAASGVLQGYR
jgi:hypothetical protein